MVSVVNTTVKWSVMCVCVYVCVCGDNPGEQDGKKYQIVKKISGGLLHSLEPFSISGNTPEVAQADVP